MSGDPRLIAMLAVLNEHPLLQDFGFGAFNPSKKTAAQIDAEILEGRQEMEAERSLAQFEAARQWLRRFPKRATLNTSGTSYGLKHAAEYAIGYTTNGVFIAAAVAEGFKIKLSHPGSPNVFLNISMKAWRRA
jgi:hypothetical protein